MTVLNEALRMLVPGQPRLPPQEQVQEQVEVLQNVVAEPVSYAVAIGPCIAADVFQFKQLRRDPLANTPANDEAWGVMLRKPSGRWTVAAFMWDNAKGYHFYAFRDQQDAREMAARLLRLNGV